MSDFVEPTQQSAHEAEAQKALPPVLEGVILQRQGEACFVMDTNNGEVFSVNPTAARIFEGCQQRETVSAVVNALITAAGARENEHAAVQADVLRLVKELQELGLCEPAGAH
ncbi:MAG: PqqD family protein [Myxococcaceae bacterium]|nr:PqqD family protein [Myxococcaceae bacterium]